MPDWLHASGWVPLSTPGHVHYPRARRYWDEEAGEEVVFCRVTARSVLPWTRMPTPSPPFRKKRSHVSRSNSCHAPCAVGVTVGSRPSHRAKRGLMQDPARLI